MTAILDRLTRAFHFPTDFMARRALRRKGYRYDSKTGHVMPPFDAAAFSASVGAWDVRPSVSQTWRCYRFMGESGLRRTVMFEWDVAQSNVTQAGAVLHVALPGRATLSCRGACEVVNAGVPGLAPWTVTAGDDFVRVFATASGDGFAATDRRDTSTVGRALIVVMPR